MQIEPESSAPPRIRRLPGREELEATFRPREGVLMKERSFHASPRSHAYGTLENEAGAEMFAVAGIAVDDPEQTAVNGRFVFYSQYRRSCLPMALFSHVFHMRMEMDVRRDSMFVKKHPGLLRLGPGCAVASERKQIRPGLDADSRVLSLDLTVVTKFRELALSFQP